jgi:hypothetical protein
VIRAEELIRAHPEQPITIGLTVASGVSAQALYEGFRRFRATTPTTMLRMVRLERIRAELKSAAPDERLLISLTNGASLISVALPLNTERGSVSCRRKHSVEHGSKWTTIVVHSS